MKYFAEPGLIKDNETITIEHDAKIFEFLLQHILSIEEWENC